MPCWGRLILKGQRLREQSRLLRGRCSCCVARCILPGGSRRKPGRCGCTHCKSFRYKQIGTQIAWQDRYKMSQQEHGGSD